VTATQFSCDAAGCLACRCGFKDTVPKKSHPSLSLILCMQAFFYRLLLHLNLLVPICTSLTSMHSRNSATKLAQTIQQRLAATADAAIGKDYTKVHKYLPNRGHKMSTLRATALEAATEMIEGAGESKRRQLSIQTQSMLWDAAQVLVTTSDYADDKLAGISLLTHVLIDHHCRQQRKAGVDLETLFLSDERKILHQIESMLDQDFLNSWIYVDGLASAFVRKLVWESENREELPDELWTWSNAPARPLDSTHPGYKVYQDSAVWKRRFPLIVCVVPVMNNQLEFGENSSQGEKLLHACTNNLKLGLGERFASTGVGWVVRYVLKHHRERGKRWMDENVDILTTEGVRYALEQCNPSEEYRQSLLARAIGGRKMAAVTKTRKRTRSGRSKS